MNKKLVLALVAMLVIATSSYFVGKDQVPQPGPLGAVPTLDGVDHPFVKINGYQFYQKSFAFTATSSFICAIQNPYGATSTIEALGAQSLTNGVTEANNLYVSTSTSAFGTSTPNLIDAFAMGTGLWVVELEKNTATTSAANNVAGVQANLLPGRTQAGGTRYVLGPTEWITWKIATTTGGTYATYDTGNCTVQLKKL